MKVRSRSKRGIERVIRTFLAGAAVSIPITITVWAIAALVNWLHGLSLEATWFWTPLRDTLAKIPGLGILLLLALIYLVGMATRWWVVSRAIGRLDFVLEHIPLVRTIYGGVRDLMRFFSGESGSMGRVVLYKVPGVDTYMLGVLTSENPTIQPGRPRIVAEGTSNEAKSPGPAAPPVPAPPVPAPPAAPGAPAAVAAAPAEGEAAEPSRPHYVAIYLPMSYQIGGYMLYVPADSVSPVDISVEEALKLAATAEVGVQKGAAPPPGGMGVLPGPVPPALGGKA